MYRDVQKKIAPHRHFTTVCSRIMRFSSKYSEAITVYQSMQNLYQLVEYTLINNRNWIQCTCCERRNPECEHDTSDSWRSIANKTLQIGKGWIVEKITVDFPATGSETVETAWFAVLRIP